MEGRRVRNQKTLNFFITDSLLRGKPISSMCINQSTGFMDFVQRSFLREPNVKYSEHVKRN